MAKQRIDLLLVARGLVESRALAQRLVMAGQVRADGQVVPKPSSQVAEGAMLEIDRGPRFVSRGGEKLDAGLEAFALDVGGLVCADVGASTGGFTDCLLLRGARRVYAIDVGHGILHWKLRNDSRVVVMERTNARDLARLPEAVDLVTIDASFISLKILLPVVAAWLGGAGSVVALIKPQFEAGKKEAARGKGVIKDPEVHQRVLMEVLDAASTENLHVRGLFRSPVEGPKGNVEFLAWFSQNGPGSIDYERLIKKMWE